MSFVRITKVSLGFCCSFLVLDFFKNMNIIHFQHWRWPGCFSESEVWYFFPTFLGREENQMSLKISLTSQSLGKVPGWNFLLKSVDHCYFFESCAIICLLPVHSEEKWHLNHHYIKYSFLEILPFAKIGKKYVFLLFAPESQ